MPISQNEIIERFCRYVEIDSESGNENELRVLLQKELKTVGCTTKIDKRGNLYAWVKGTDNLPTLMFSAHMDTVKPGNGVIPVIKKDRIVSQGKTILGSDDKSGITQIMTMLDHVMTTKYQGPSLMIVFTVEEETGIRGARAISKVQADYGFALDVDGDIGRVVTQAPSHDTFEVNIHGKSAHAGIEPEQGINAIVVASKAISRMKLGRINRDTVANIGMISGGTATNIVPDQVTIKGEARSHREDRLTAQINRMKQTIQTTCREMGATFDFVPDREYYRFNVNRHRKLIKLCKAAGQVCGCKVTVERTGGGSDANHFNRIGIPTAVISTGMRKVHTTEEYILIRDLVKGAEFLLALVNQAGGLTG